MRYFLSLSYLGTSFSGWQRQPNASSVQETLETALSTILRRPTEITGCGRTDAGVHARYYIAHFDAEDALPPTFIIGLNSLLPPTIAVKSVHPVHAEAHARYDAYERSYEYHIALNKDPFAINTAWFFPQNARLDIDLMQQAAALIPHYEAFFPFCKTHSGVDSYICQVKEAVWELRPEEDRLMFKITANRFLRGMVRLIVGASVQAGMGKISIEAIDTALREQTMLGKSLSVPAEGLALTGVKYPFGF